MVTCNSLTRQRLKLIFFFPFRIKIFDLRGRSKGADGCVVTTDAGNAVIHLMCMSGLALTVTCVETSKQHISVLSVRVILLRKNPLKNGLVNIMCVEKV